MDGGRRRRGSRWTAAAQLRRDSGRREVAAGVAQSAARVVEWARRNPRRIMSTPRFADWILRRVLPPGKRGESILGDLHEEFLQLPDPGSRFPSRSLWYWRQTLRLALRYAFSRSPQQPLTYPRANVMWFELSSDLKTAFRNFLRAPGTSALIVFTLAFAIAAATIGFAFADLAILRGLPVDDTSKVVSVQVNDTQGSMSGVYRVSGA